MKQIKKLKQYCKTHLLKAEFEDNILKINNETYEILDDSVKIFDEDFEFISKTEHDLTTGHIYEFCGRWYLQKAYEEVTMQELKCIGEVNQKLPTNTFLGIHSGNELLNGIGEYKEWIAKANFLGVKTLGICEKHTLAGVIAFQNICRKNNIKPIIGLTVSIQKKLSTYDVKLYAKNFTGWQNLLKLNEVVNVQEKSAVDEAFFIEHTEGLVVVFDPKSLKYSDLPKIEAYYQLDTVVFESEEEDIEYTNNLEVFIKSDIEPVAICDAYYLEQADYQAREALWSIGKKFDSKTRNQYFKNNDQYAKELISMFDSESTFWIKLYKKAVENLENVVKACNFTYDTDNRRLPKYVMTPKEKEKFGTNEKFFIHLLKIGFEERGIKPNDEYINRLKEEVRVLKKGDVIDYFLNLYDVIQNEKKDGGLVGFGRGSAGGSVVSYLLDIIQIDPLKHELLFERFLNDGRMGEIGECKAYKINDSLILNEGSILRVLRNSKEIILPVEELKQGDEILKHN